MWGSDRETCAANCVPTSVVGAKSSNNIFGGETELLNNQNHVPTSVVDMCKKLSKNVFGGKTELLENQVQEVKALGGGRWRWSRHQSTKQTDIEFAMNQVDLE